METCKGIISTCSSYLEEIATSKVADVVFFPQTALFRIYNFTKCFYFGEILGQNKFSTTKFIDRLVVCVPYSALCFSIEKIVCLVFPIARLFKFSFFQLPVISHLVITLLCDRNKERLIMINCLPTDTYIDSLKKNWKGLDLI